jgi:hypothetical protein
MATGSRRTCRQSSWLLREAAANPSLERDLHRHGTWPAKRSLSSSASRAKHHAASGPSAQTLDAFNTRTKSFTNHQEIFMAGKYKKNLIEIGDKKVAVYATPKLSTALEAITEDMTLYEGVKLQQILEAMYEQGKKDGARSVFDAIHDKMKEAEKAIPHRNPGKPKAKK